MCTSSLSRSPWGSRGEELRREFHHLPQDQAVEPAPGASLDTHSSILAYHLRFEDCEASEAAIDWRARSAS